MSYNGSVNSIRNYRKTLLPTFGLVCSLFLVLADSIPAYAEAVGKTLTIDMAFIEEYNNSAIADPTDDTGAPLTSVDITIVDDTTGENVTTLTLTKQDGWTGEFTAPDPSHSYSLSYNLPSAYTTSETQENTRTPEPDNRTITIKPAPNIATSKIEDGTTFLLGTNKSGASGIVQTPTSAGAGTSSVLSHTTSDALNEALKTAIGQGQYTLTRPVNDQQINDFADSVSAGIWTATYLGYKNNEYHYELTNSEQTLTQIGRNGSAPTRSDIVAYDGRPTHSAFSAAVANCPWAIEGKMTSAFSWNGSEAWFSYNLPEVVGSNNYYNCGRNIKGNGTASPYLYSSIGQAGTAGIRLYEYSDITTPSPDWTESEHITITAVRVFNPPPTALTLPAPTPLVLMIALPLTLLAMFTVVRMHTPLQR